LTLFVVNHPEKGCQSIVVHSSRKILELTACRLSIMRKRTPVRAKALHIALRRILVGLQSRFTKCTATLLAGELFGLALTAVSGG